MKRVWLTLCAVMLIVSACATETIPVLIPSAEGPTGRDPTAAEERAALAALYQATDGANWTRSDNWLSDAPVAAWYGVVTDGSGRVTELNLPANGLIGPIPDLSALTILTRLHLQSNQLSGPLPDLSSLTKLTRLDLASNQLSGPAPDLGALSNLTELDLGGNRLSGPVPDMSALVDLISLSLTGNQLCLPEDTGLSGLNEVAAAHLKSLNLPVCQDAELAPARGVPQT